MTNVNSATHKNLRASGCRQEWCVVPTVAHNSDSGHSGNLDAEELIKYSVFADAAELSVWGTESGHKAAVNLTFKLM